MTMEEVRRYERETQEATNELIGLVAPTISVSEVGQPTVTHSAPASAPSTPLGDEAPDFLAPPKNRPRKKSAPETLTLPALRERAGAE
ncbi:cytoplasmic phosphatidylinositol transfer protein 1-like [Grus japonensis]|uniref:Cytoplasmic phosphatidylinositol transfer protein 1-like n=2 Tax=Grus TaxID=9114 RepID=A0ABC9XGW2_GRUJA